MQNNGLTSNSWTSFPLASLLHHINLEILNVAKRNGLLKTYTYLKALQGLKFSFKGRISRLTCPGLCISAPSNALM